MIPRYAPSRGPSMNRDGEFGPRLAAVLICAFALLGGFATASSDLGPFAYVGAGGGASTGVIPGPTPTYVTATVAPTVETGASHHAGDTADDAAIWIHPTDPSLSLVIGDDKDGGLMVWGLNGVELQYIAGTRYNNVDIRYNVPLSGQFTSGTVHTTVALVGVTDEGGRQIDLFKVNPATRQLEAAGSIGTGVTGYGGCLYHSPTTGKYYFFVPDQAGVTEQYELRDGGNGQIAGTRVRQFDVGGITEGCVADDVFAQVYFGEEDVAIWKYGAEPDTGSTRTQVDKVGTGGNLAADIEGLSIYYAGASGGYLLASSQGESRVVVYERTGSNTILGKFSVGASGTIDSVSGSDGLDVTNFPLGSGFGSGLFAIHDSSNSGGTASNIKYVPWASIATALGLTVDTSWDPRLVGSGPLPPPPPPPPPPTPVDIPVNAFRGRYFDNADFTNQRVERIDTAINFDWGTGSPDPLIAPDTFSVLWEGYWDFAAAGVYRFTMTTDDGMRLFFDNTSVLDSWIPQAPTTYTRDVDVAAGQHFIKVEWYDGSAGAIAKVSWAPVTEPPPGTIPVGAFLGRYFDNEDLTNQKLERVDAAINFNWGPGSPDPLIAPDTFSVRWEGYWDFPSAAVYRFTATTDDGMRIWVDNASVLDAWVPQSPTTYTRDAELASGRHFIRVESFERTNTAVAQVSWAYFAPSSQPLPTARILRSPTYPRPGTSITFDATTSTSLNGSLQARWDWQNDGTWDVAFSATLTASYAYASAGTYTVRLEVRDAAGLMDNETQSVAVDGAAPVTTASLAGTSGSGGWYTSAVTVTLTRTDDSSGVASTQVRKDGGAWTTYSTPVSVSGDGTHTVEFTSTDRAGNVEAAKSSTIKIDGTSPSTTHALQGTLGGASWYASAVTVILTASDGTSGVAMTRYRVDAGSWITYSTVIVVSANGSHVVEYDSTDAAGNPESTKNVPFQIGSSTGPTSTLSASGTTGPEDWYVTPATVTLSATDPDGRPVTISYRVDGAAWRTYTAPFTIGDGAHTLEYYATNDLGLRESTKTAAFDVDTVAPTTTHQLGGSLVGGAYQGSVDVTLAASDATSGVASIQYRIDGGPWSTYTSLVSVTANGAHTFEYASTDRAGNEETTKSASFSIQSVGGAPASTLNVAGTQGDSGWYTTPATVELSAGGGSGLLTIQYRVDGGAWTEYAGSFTLADGRHLLEYYAGDAGGVDEAIRAASIDVDTTPPAFERVGPSGIVTDDTVALDWSAVDETSGIVGYEMSLDGGAFLSIGEPGSVTLTLSDGDHYVALRATDAAGNSQVQATSFRVDTGLFSPNGPISGLPLYIVAELMIAALILGALGARKRRAWRRYREFTERMEARGRRTTRGRKTSGARGQARRRAPTRARATPSSRRS